MSNELNEAFKKWLDSTTAPVSEQQENTPAYDRGADVSRPDKGAGNTLIDQQRQEEKRRREAEQKERERLAAYDWIMNARSDGQAVSRNIALNQLRQAEAASEAQAREYRNSEQYRQSQKMQQQMADRMAADTGMDVGFFLAQNQDPRLQEIQAVGNYYRQQRETLQDSYIMEKDLKDLAKWTREEQDTLMYFAINRFNTDMAPEGVPIGAKAYTNLAPLMDKYGHKRVMEIAESFTRSQNAEQARSLTEAASQWADSSGLGALGHSAGSVAANTFGIFTAPLGYLQEAGMRTGRYRTLDPNNMGNLPSVYANTVRTTVAENIRESEGGAARFLEEKGYRGIADGAAVRKLAALGYQGTLSAADNLVRIHMGGGLAGSLGLAALGSFGSTMAEASGKGATPGQALILATASAGIEVLTERYSVERFLSAAAGGPRAARQILTEAAKQGGVEVTEEEMALLLNLAAEAAVLRENSGYNQQIGELVANGMSYEQAKEQANQGLWNQAVETAAQSFVAGSVMSGAQSTGQYIRQRGATAAGTEAVEEASAEDGEVPANEDTNAPGNHAAQETMDALAEGLHRLQQENGPREGAQEAETAADLNRAAAEVIPGEQAVQEPEAGYSDEVIRAALDEMTEADLAPVKNVQVPIQKDMPESARYDALKDRAIAAVTDTESANHPQEMGSLAALKAKAKGQAEKIIKPLAKKLGILNRSMNTPDLEVEFQFSGGGLNESLARQLRYGGSYADFGRVMVNLDKVLANAVLVEQHGDKYKGTIRENRNLENVSVLFGVFRDGDSVIPVQMEIKKTSDTGSHLYMTVTMTKIEADVKGKTVDPGQAPSLLSASEYNIADIFREINPQDAHFLKYVPDGFLTEEQIAAKQRALAEDAAKIQRYKETGRRGPVEPEGAGEGFEAMGAADYNFSPYTRMQNEYGNIPEGENAVRPDDAPISTDGTDRVSYTARTAIGAEVTPDEFVPLIENEVVRGGFSFIPITNSETVQRATAEITANGWERSRGRWEQQVRNGVTGADVTAMGALLYNHAVNSGNYQEAMDILLDYQRSVRNAAQGVQAARILKMLTPENRLYMIRRSIQRMVEDMDLDQEITIDEDLARRYQEAQTDEEADNILDEIARDVARQIPSTWAERFTDLRYLNMLGNFRTQARNLVGNLANKGLYMAKDQLAATIEDMASLFSGGRFQRSKVHHTDRATRRAARADYENVADWISGGGRTQDNADASTDFERRVRENRRIFRGTGLMEGYRRATNWAMNNRFFGDAAFGRSAYARALAGYLNARGIRTNDLSTVDPETLSAAREYAVRQAQEATFRDNNQVSTFVSQALRGRNTPAWARVIGEAVMPFRKTPANVLVRAEEFSPLGLINSAVNTVRAARGNISGAELVDSWAKSLTGTGLFALGWALANMGFLRGGPDEDEDKAAFDRLNGYQDYSIQLPGGINFTIDAFSPTALPLLLGGQLDKVLDGEMTWADLEGMFSTLADPMIEMSMLSGLNDTIDAIRYADNSLGQFLVNASFNYLSQALGNTLMGQMERSTEDSRMTTYIDKDSNVPVWLQRNLGKLSQKIPVWDYQQTPYIDQWGREQRNPQGIANWLYNTLSPSYVDRAEVDSVAKELYRLNKAQSDVNVFPQSPEAAVTYTDKDGNRIDNYNLSMDEADKLKRTEGQAQAKLVADLIGGEDYKALTDKQKAEAVSLCYDYARELARGEVLPGYDGKPAWMEGIEGNETGTIIAKVAGADLGDAMTSLTSAWKNGKDATEAAAELEEGYQVYKGLSEPMRETVFEGLSERARGYIEARDAGQSPESYAGAAKTVTLAEHHMEELRDAWKEGEDGSAAFAGLDQTYEAYRKLDEGQRKQVQEEVSSKTRYFLTAREAGVNTETFTGLYQQFDQINSDSEATGVDKAEEWSYTLQKAVEAGEITQRQAYKLRTEMSIFQIIPAEAKKYNEMTAAGISADDSQDLLWLLDGLEIQEGYSDVRDVQKWEAIAETSFLNDREKDAVLKIYMPDYDPTDRQPNKTELKYDYARQVFGLTPELYVAAYQAHVENSTKTEKIEAWRELGFSSKEAYLLYRLFASSGKDKIDVVAWYNGK